MSDTRLNPYLNFNGNTREAMEFYKSVFGGELTLNTFGDSHDPSMPIPDGYADKIMHADLRSGNIIIMASEGRPGTDVKAGDNVSLSFSGSDAAELTGYFNALAESGMITMPLAAQSWGDQFGMLTDKFGINWLVNINQSA